ncbi:MAG TPA: hypothetical protein VK787_00820 [Puia sp.]|jgi:hypothetical protein|nr:hypothetical protein [Puia sp.]
MEVHHHPHVEKKNFKEYFLEFLMIFLAVTMGFFAESIRERVADNSKEKEFVMSMIEDAATDTANIRIAVQLNEKRITHLDSLCTVCFNYSATPNEDAEIYRLYRYGLVHPAFISPTERTLLQLKNSGGMRLIRKKAAVDSIIAYDDMAKKLADQQTYYERYQNESVNSSLELLNFKYYQSSLAGARSKNLATDYASAQMLNRDKTKVIQLGNRIAIYKGVVDFYNIRLLEMNDHAVNLISTLKKEYHLENE